MTATIAFALGGLLAIVLQFFEEQRQGDRFSQTHPLHPLPIRCHYAIGKSNFSSSNQDDSESGDRG